MLFALLGVNDEPVATRILNLETADPDTYRSSQDRYNACVHHLHELDRGSPLY